MDKSKSKDSSSFAAALRILTRRDRSETELRQKLEQFGFSHPAIEAAVKQCKDYNYLNDDRYAAERARSLMRTGRGVGKKIKLDLQRRGIEATIIDQALETAEKEFPTDHILREQLTLHFPAFDYFTADDREKRRVISFFQRRGFSLDKIFRGLKEEP